MIGWKSILRIALFCGMAAPLSLRPGTGLRADDDVLPKVYTDWKSFHKEDGLPSEKVYCIAVDQDRIWAGTDNGLALYEDGKWTTFGVQDGLAFPAVLCLAVDPETRDVWAGTMKGLTRISAGRFETYTQFNSGLPNDVVFGVCMENQNVWIATTNGTARFHVKDKKFDVYTPANSPQHEPWGYFVTSADGKVYAALWGGGVLEFDLASEQWKSYRDPDGEMEVDILRDDGLIHVITTSVSYVEKILWVSTYFGMSRYDGRHWRGYIEGDSGLPSNFINFVKARERVAWVCTDRGLGVVNGDTNRWVSYVPVDPVWKHERMPSLADRGPMEGAKGWEARIYDDSKLINTVKLEQGLANNHIYGVDFQGDTVWVATSKGISRGRVGGGTGK